MRRRFLWLGFAMAILSALGLALPATAGGVVSASSFTGTAIEGYDPVAYFTEGHPVEGESGFAHDWMDATWYFASAENRDQFAADPDRYAPQYGGYCAWAVARGYTAKIDPEAWKIVDGKRLPQLLQGRAGAVGRRTSPATSPKATPTGRRSAPTSRDDGRAARRPRSRMARPPSIAEA